MLNKTWFCQRRLQAPQGQGTEAWLSESAYSPFLRIGSLYPAVQNQLRVFTGSRQRLVTGYVVPVLVLLPACCATPGKPLPLSGPQRQVDTARPCDNLTHGEGSSGDEARLGWASWVMEARTEAGQKGGLLDLSERYLPAAGLRLSLRHKTPWKGRALGVGQRPRSAEGWAGITQQPAYPRNRSLSGRKVM